MPSGWVHDINKNCSVFVSNISRGNVYILRKLTNHHPHNIFLRSLKLSTVDSIATTIIPYFEDKPIGKRKAATQLFYVQLEYDKHSQSGEKQSLACVWCAYYSVVFQEAPIFLSSTHCSIRQTSVLSTDSTSQYCVSFMRKMDLKYYQTVTGKLEHCCKVTGIAAMVATFYHARLQRNEVLS